MNLSEAITSAKQALTQPSVYFGPDRSVALTTAVTAAALVALPLTLLQLIFGLLNQNHFDAVNALLVTGGGIPVSPYSALYMPFVWAVLLLFGAALRYVFTVLLGDETSFAQMLWIGTLAALPLIFVSGVFGVVNAALPMDPASIVQGQMSTSASVRAGVQGFILLLAFVYEGFVCIAAFRGTLSQNTGRAVLTWLFPPFITFAACCGLLFMFTGGFG